MSWHGSYLVVLAALKPKVAASQEVAELSKSFVMVNVEVRACLLTPRSHALSHCRHCKGLGWSLKGKEREEELHAWRRIGGNKLNCSLN